MKIELKIMLGRDGKNIDSTDDVKRGQKNIKSEKFEIWETFFTEFTIRGGSTNLHFLSEGGQQF